MRAILVLIAVFLLAASTLDQVTALKCWRCSSDAANAEFCADPFDEKSLTTDQLRWSYVQCADPPQAQFGSRNVQHTVCKKLNQLVNGKPVITRSCFWEDVGAPANQCATSVSGSPSYVQIQSCRTCTTDGCNGQKDFGLKEEEPAVVEEKAEKEDMQSPADEKKADSGATATGTATLWMLAAVGGLVAWVQGSRV